MELPDVPSVRAMHSWTTLTPFYSEDVIYSRAELLKETEDGVSPMLYLKTIFSDEWENFCERIGSDMLDTDILDTDKCLQVNCVRQKIPLKKLNVGANLGDSSRSNVI
jgi:hypothetical protein